MAGHTFSIAFIQLINQLQSSFPTYSWFLLPQQCVIYWSSMICPSNLWHFLRWVSGAVKLCEDASGLIQGAGITDVKETDM